MSEPIMMICHHDRVPLQRTARKGYYQCPVCTRTRSRDYWKAHQPGKPLHDAMQRRRKKHHDAGPPPPPPPDITTLGPSFRKGIRKLIDRVLAGVRDCELVIGEVDKLVADRRHGDAGNTRIDEFDSRLLDKATDVVTEVYITQEIANLLGLEPWLKRKLIRNLVDRRWPPLVRHHPNP
jgi:hypothetical protein